MLKKIFLMITVIFIFSASTTATVNAELYNGSPESLLSSLQKVAAEHKIKFWGMKKNDYKISVNYGSSESNEIRIFSSHNKSKSVSFVSLSFDTTESEVTSFNNGADSGILLASVLINSGASRDGIQKFWAEYMKYASDLNYRIVNNKSISRSKLNKTFNVDCKSQNKVIYVELHINEYGGVQFIVTPYK